MPYTLNDKIRDLKPYDPIVGKYNIRLDANESFLKLPNEILTQIFGEIATTSFNRYPDPIARGVCYAFAEHYNLNSQLVVAGNGSDELISIILSAFLKKGDKMITLAPDFSMYGFYSSIVEAECVTLEKRKDLTIDVDGLINVANSNDVKLIIFSNPCNPTSMGLNREDVRRLIRSVNALVVLDEAYMDFWDQSLLNEVSEYDNLIILKTCSKAFGMAAVRLGFAVANQVITNVLMAVKSPYNVNSLTQAAGAAVLSQHQLLNDSIQKLVESRKNLQEAMKQLENAYPNKMMVYDSCTNFIFIKTALAKQLYEYLMENSIAIRLMGNYLRITAGSEEENAELVTIVEAFLRKEDAL